MHGTWDMWFYFKLANLASDNFFANIVAGHMTSDQSAAELDHVVRI